MHKQQIFHCDICDCHDYTSQSQLLRHKLVMHNQGESPLHCDQCDWRRKEGNTQ